jgi:hypothetical protein
MTPFTHGAGDPANVRQRIPQSPNHNLCTGGTRSTTKRLGDSARRHDEAQTKVKVRCMCGGGFIFPRFLSAVRPIVVQLWFISLSWRDGALRSTLANLDGWMGLDLYPHPMSSLPWNAIDQRTCDFRGVFGHPIELRMTTPVIGPHLAETNPRMSGCRVWSQGRSWPVANAKACGPG